MADPEARGADHGPAEATAPGDLPPGQVEARQLARRWQFRHDNTITPLAPRPGEAVEVWATSGRGLALERAVLLYTVDGSFPDHLSARQLPMEVQATEWDSHAGYLRSWRAAVPAQPPGTLVRYRIVGTRAGTGDAVWARDGSGFHFRAAGDGLTTFAYLVEGGAAPVVGVASGVREAPPASSALPQWVRDAVIYQIFLDRFHSGTAAGALPPGRGPHERHGGSLRGVQSALGYLAELGVTCLWLSPLCASETYHRYDTTDLYAVDADLGSADALRELTMAAHARGMRVLLDLVPNHCSWHHPAFVAACHDRSAPTYAWFTFDHWPDRYRSFLDLVPSLPAFNTEDPGARAHIIGSAVHWLRTCGVDGFRLDHVIGPGMDFWVAFRAAVRAVAPQCFTIGEATDTPDCLRRYRSRLDSVLDFPLATALRSSFGTGEVSVADLDSFLGDHARYMASGPVLVSFLDNHDMNRFLFVAGGDTRRLRLAALCQFTLEAVPALYYGTEVGMNQAADVRQGGDAQARGDMPWDPAAWDRELLTFYRALILLRRTHAALWQGGRHTVHLNAATGTYAYARTLQDEDGVVTALNLSPRERTLLLPRPVAAGALRCLLASGPGVALQVQEQAVRVLLPPLTGAILGVAEAGHHAVGRSPMGVV
jgi:glycosidase